jgi:hypothetical protein
LGCEYYACKPIRPHVKMANTGEFDKNFDGSGIDAM